MGPSLAPRTAAVRHDSTIPKLLLLNGPPGAGKSTLAGRYADEHPLTLVVEVDALRAALGGWQRDDASKLVARDLALALARAHLGAGRDVVVPQYVGRADFADALAGLAASAGATFVHVVVTAPVVDLVDRFRRRRTELAAGHVRHPEADLADADIDRAIVDAAARIAAFARARGVAVVVASGDVDADYRALLEAIGDS